MASRRRGRVSARSLAKYPERQAFSKKEEAVIDFLHTYPQENQGRLASIREISRGALGSNFPNSARQVLLSLALKGAIAQDRRSKRYYLPMTTFALNRQSGAAVVRRDLDHVARYRVDSEATRFLLNRVSYDGRGRVPLESARLDDLGYSIVAWPLPVGVSGRITPEQGLIVVNNSDSLERRTFTLGHEFGHLILHVLPGLASSCSELATLSGEEHSRLEREADMFAALLVLPDSALRMFVITRDGPRARGNKVAELELVQEVSREFMVAPMTAALRLEAMDYIASLPGARTSW